jgi:hypothetical protein
MLLSGFSLNFRSLLLLGVFLLNQLPIVAQEILPPVPLWNGKSIGLIAKNNNPWITPAEKSDFKATPSYAETMEWLNRLCKASRSQMQMVSIGTSGNNQSINMVVASSENSFTKEALLKSPKKLILIQAGIHSGEIDGKDAGMMLLRDIAFGTKKDLLQSVNILFIPILSVDGHERTSPYNRVNQRGPENMGWRTNASNLNLNRDYTKLDTEEIKSVVNVINEYDPDLYLDLHVTDGADYQYDITYGFGNTFSPAIGKWLTNVLSPFVDKHLKEMGHIPGPLVFALNEKDFKDGMTDFAYTPRFSNAYGDIRHLPAILLENHSLKPFRQRVLGTYVFLESIIRILGAEGATLQKAIQEDKKIRNKEFVLTWKANPVKDSVFFLGIESYRKKSAITNSEYVVWTGKPVNQKIAFTRFNTPDLRTDKPKVFYVPAYCKEIISRMKIHGIEMETINEKMTKEVNIFTVIKSDFADLPTEGHVTVTADFATGKRQETFYPGSVKINVDQPLGDLVMYLLHPSSGDSFFQWGFFPGMFVRAEYMEQYVTEPLAEKMLASDPKLRAEFDARKKDDPAFSNDPASVYLWFYSKSPYYDSNYLVYPIAFE